MLFGIKHRDRYSLMKMTESSKMVTVFNIDNSNNIVYIHRPDMYYSSFNNGPSRLILRPNNIPMGPYDFNLPGNFNITIHEDWDTHDNHILAKLSDERTKLSLMDVIVDKYLLSGIAREKESFLLVGEKVFYLENPDLMLYRTDNILESSNNKHGEELLGNIEYNDETSDLNDSL
jgi:hypothetical protein